MQDLEDVLLKINAHMHEGACPQAGCIGECSGIDMNDEGLCTAYMRIWDKAFNDSARVAKWFKDLGAYNIVVSHALFDEINGDRDGQCVDGPRAWEISFTFTGPKLCL